MDLDIQDYTIPQAPLIAKRVHIQISELKFGESVKFNVYFYLSGTKYDMTTLKIETVLIDGDDYKAWNNDDQYIINLILAKFGLVKKPVEEEPNIELIVEEKIVA